VKDALETAAGRHVSREKVEQLDRYTQLLIAENERQNLISQSTIGELYDRHILDSAQLARFEPRRGASWADVGSGAGLPGIVIACLVEGPVALIEPRRLRAEFLQAVVDELDLGTRVHVRQEKVERVTGSFDVIAARAVAPLFRLFAMTSHLSHPETVWVLPKGRKADSELAEAKQAWQGAFHVEQSVTDAGGRILVATGVRAKQG
jgi:16S rRNA (guanine527-N7)-methyltransferase